MTVPVFEYLAVVVLAAIAWQLARFRPNWMARVGDLVERIMHNRNTRIALILVWWWLGWHFFTV
jgi:hypothetical protein